MKDILVSIVVPCYNCSESLKRCVESIRNQTYRSIEIILVDDGSEDDSPRQCDEYTARDKRIVTIHQDNGGLVRAWKSGVRRATGEFVAFCDSDDYIDDDLVEKTVRKAIETDADIVVCGVKAEYPDKSQILLDNKLNSGLYDGDSFQMIKKRFLFTGKMGSQIILNSRCSKLYKRTLLLKCLDDISDDLTNGEDAVTTYAVVMQTERLYSLAGFHPYHYIRNDQSMVGRHDPKWFAKMVMLREELAKISTKYGCQDAYQIDNFFFSYVLMYAKKEIVRSSAAKKNVINSLFAVRQSEVMADTLKNADISHYSVISGLFAILFIQKRMTLLYYLTKAARFLGYGKP